MGLHQLTAPLPANSPIRKPPVQVSALVAHPAVREAAIVARPDPKWGERPVAFVVFKEGLHATDEELRSQLADRFPKWWLPDEYRTVPGLPKTSTGKVSKRLLRDELAQSRDQSPSTP